MATLQMKWDVFISHASEDKNAIVAPLAESLQRFGLRVWYDAFTLTVGDSLSRSIDDGLAESRFGLVVLSPHFLEKNWPEYELRGLTARELGRDKVILPIWHNIGRDEILKFSPPLADKLAIPTDRLSPLEIAVKIIEVVSPELFTRIHRRLAYLNASQSAPVEVTEAHTLHAGPIRHKKLPKEQLERIRLIRAALLDVRPMTMRDWVDGFRRDTHPADEIAIWEHHAAVFLEVAAYLQLSRDRRRQLFAVLAAVMQGAVSENLDEALKAFTEEEGAIVLNSLKSSTPVLEFAKSTLPLFAHSRETKRRVAGQQIDVQDGNSSPEELPRELMAELLRKRRS